MSTSRKKIYFIVGPTGSGKTSLSIELAKNLPPPLTPPQAGGEQPRAEIISADSRQIYKDLNLSSGKVTKEEMENIPHHMLDIINPGEYFSVVDFTQLAVEKIQEIYSRGNIPIICGGTGFYIDSLLYNYNLPEAKKDEVLRSNLEDKNTDELFKILKRKLFSFGNLRYFFRNTKTFRKFSDPEFGKNKHRIMRAIEIVSQQGYITELKKVERFNKEEYAVEMIHTSVPRNILREKIYKRIIDRMDAGMIEEIVAAKEKYNLSFEYLKKLGLEFKWIAKFLQKEITREEMTDGLFIEICQYAKRQDSWFRRYRQTPSSSPYK